MTSDSIYLKSLREHQPLIAIFSALIIVGAFLYNSNLHPKKEIVYLISNLFFYGGLFGLLYIPARSFFITYYGIRTESHSKLEEWEWGNLFLFGLDVFFANVTIFCVVSAFTAISIIFYNPQNPSTQVLVLIIKLAALVTIVTATVLSSMKIIKEKMRDN